MLKGNVPNCAAKETVRMSQMYRIILFLGCQKSAIKGCNQG